MTDGLDRLKVLINSSTPIVVMETSEEMRAVNLVRAACSELNMATFEWSIADGLVRSGSNAPVQATNNISAPNVWNGNVRGALSSRTALSPGGSESERLMRAVMSSTGSEGTGA